MAVTRKEHAGTVLTTSLQTLLTFSTGLITGGAVVQAIQGVLNGATARIVTVYLIPTGQVAADQYLIYRGTLFANDSAPLPIGPQFAAGGAFLQAKQDAGADVTLRVTAFEEA